MHDDVRTKALHLLRESRTRRGIMPDVDTPGPWEARDFQHSVHVFPALEEPRHNFSRRCECVCGVVEEPNVDFDFEVPLWIHEHILC